MRFIHRKQSRESKIRNLDIEVLVEKDVVGFNITVDDLGGVEILQGRGSFNSDFEPNRPRKLARVCLWTM